MPDDLTTTEELDDASAVADAISVGTATILFDPQANAQVLPETLAEYSDGSPPLAAPGENPKAKRVVKNNADKLAGKTLGIYRCDTLLGRGAMGAVYLAFHQQLERRCALKVLSPKYVETDADYVSRFREEAIAVANLHHPNVVMAHAVGTHDGLHFLEMEFVTGNSLQKTLDSQLRLSPNDALRITAQIADGLAAAHRAGLIHRDVKPDNVLMTKESHGLGRAKIGDFGLAKRIRGRGEKAFDGLVGTPHYMAPELFSGSAASPSTDVYALGVCLFRMLTGRLPFNGKTVKQLMSQAMSQPFPDVRADCADLPNQIVELLNWLVHCDPGQRPRDADQAQPRLFSILGEIRDLRQLLTEAFREEPDIAWSAGEGIDEFDAIVKLRNGRRQRVLIAPSDDNVPFRQIQIFSIGGPASPDHYEVALRRNAVQPHGSIAVRDVDGQPHFVVVENHSRAKVAPDELCRSVRHIARHADAVEEFLTGQDVN
ncbi:MAG: serine/threonine protein kinase [Planctomycetaceae bacterium]|nr:serine/threonine protein kinase [Planctomycetaceae bacterium]